MKRLIVVLDVLAFIFFGVICACLLIGAVIVSSLVIGRRHVKGEVRELSFAVFDLISDKYQSMFEDALLNGYIARHYYIYLDFNNGRDRFENIENKIFFCSIAAHPDSGIYRSGFHKISMLFTELKALSRAFTLIWTNNINFVKAHDPHLLGLNGLVVAKLFGLPCVLHMNSDFDMKYRGTGKISSPLLVSRGVERLFESTVMRFYDLIMADRKFYSKSRNFPSDSKKKYRAFGVRVDRSHYSPPASRHNLMEELGIAGRKIVLYVGRLHPVKYPEDAIKAFTIIKESIPEAVLVIVGAGVLKSALERMILEYGMGSSVSFLGQIKYERLIDVLYTVDVLLAPHGGVTLVESALAATPAVAYDFDWHSEFLEDGEMGYVVPFRDFESMARKAIDLLSDDALRARMGQRSRDVAVSGYSREISMEKEKKVYEELIGV